MQVDADAAAAAAVADAAEAAAAEAAVATAVAEVRGGVVRVGKGWKRLGKAEEMATEVQL